VAGLKHGHGRWKHPAASPLVTTTSLQATLISVYTQMRDSEIEK
jgi:hypothetical protein